MAELHIYPDNASVPAHFEHQIRSFVRIHWYDSYVHDLDEPLRADSDRPIHLVLAERHGLFSNTAIIRRQVEHAGQRWNLFGVGGVFTYPAFRGRGYGAQIVGKATELILNDPEADFGMLFTMPSLEKFYGQHGWEAMPQLRVMHGQPPEEHDEFTMMLFVSERAKAARSSFETGSIHVGGWPW